MIPKIKRIRLKGKALSKLCEEVYNRDSGLCVYCSHYVEPGATPHHEPLTSQGGQDRLEDMAMLCNDCHYLRHNAAEGVVIGQKVKAYLSTKYDHQE